MADHAAMSPSSAAMWMNCSASITLAEGRTRPSSRYAKEGTAAHRIAEMIIAGDLFPPGKIEVEGDEFIVGLPMLRALNTYVSIVEGLRLLDADIHVEKRVKVSGSGGHVWGTTDCAAKVGRDLHIVDLKYGRGVPVPPSSAQLKIYALAAIDTLWPAELFDRVHLTVVQPRIAAVPTVHTMPAVDLALWGANELAPAMRRVLDDDPTEVPGHWCRWCVRRSECVAFKSHKSSVAAEIFDDGLDLLT